MYSYSRELPIVNDYEIIVVGGGPAGCAAAAAAGREGKKTLLVETTGALGGMGTLGLVPAWAPFSDKQKIVYRGIAGRMLEQTRQALPHVGDHDWVDWVPIDPEALKRQYDELMEENGVHVLFHTLVVDVESENGHVTGLIAANKGGLALYRAQVYVDCTGDADIAIGAGAPYEKGGEDGDMQAASLCFTLTNVDEYAYKHGPRLHPHNPDSPIHQIIKDGKYPMIPDTHLCQELIGPRTVGFNAGHLWDVDGSDPQSVSGAQIKGRKLAKAIRDALAEYVPAAFANAQLVQTAPLVGIRETRRIRGDYVLSREDYVARRSFPDEIGRNCYYLDIHYSPKAIERARETGIPLEKETRYAPGESHGIPYRSLLPLSVDNVLVAGRCISTDRAVQGSTRVMPCCLVTGEAAGVAAALSLPTGQTRQVDTQLLREKLRGYGAFIE